MPQSELDPRARIFSGHSTERGTYRIVRESGTPNWLIVLTVSGSGKINEDIVTQPGSISIWSPNSRQDYGLAADHWEQLWAHFVPALAYDALVKSLTEHADFWQGNAQNFEKSVAKMQQVVNAESTLRGLNALESLLLDLIPNQNSLPENINRALSFIRKNLRHDIGVQEVASAVGISMSSLNTLFRAHLSQSPRKVIERERMLRAKELVLETSRTIQSISDDLGYSSPFYFSLRFKEHFGLSPSYFRSFSAVS
jgi:AraC family transcriptional regulator, arabinose operon regulatory protein